MENKKRLYIDMDGTLAEWRSFKYELTSLEDVQNASKLIYQKLNEENYFYNLKPQENVVNAIRNIVQNHKDSIDVYILSASVSDVATNDKNRWLDRYLPDIDSEHRIFTKDGEDKRNFITGGVMENDYLLDDRTLNLTQWVQSGKGIKLLNGQNHTAKTWKGDMISYDTTPQLLVGKILSIINESIHVQDEQPFHTEQTITIKPITTNAFENIEVWENERKALQEQYLKIVRDKNFRALEWYTDMGGHYIFHPSVKSGDWQLSFIDNKGIPTSDSQFKDVDIGTGKRWIDPIAEFPHSRIDKPITIKALFENPNREREIMAEQERSVEDYITSMQKEQLYPRYAVLQLAEGLDETHYRRFEPLENLKEKGIVPNGDNYELVYFNVNDPNNSKVNLDSVYEHFNANEPRPSNYYGHSLSVSDVVLVSENGTDIKAYYCDDIGFSELDDNFLTKKIQDRFNTGTTIKDELELLFQEKFDNGLSKTATDRLNYLHEEYTTVFNMANKRAVLEETEKLNTVFDYELLYGGTQNEDSITVFNEQLNRAFIKPTIFNENSADELQKIVDKSYFEALADKDLHNENLNYDNISSFQIGDRVWLGNGHSVEIMEAQAIDHTDLPLPIRYKAEWHIDDSNYFDPEFPNETEPATTFLLSDVDVVERNGKNILEPPVEEVTKETEELPVKIETYKYYSTQRPIGMGTYPRENSLEIVNYDTRNYVETIDREAWGEITYSQPLTERQISDYEFVADPNIKLTLEQRVQNDDLLNAQDLIEEIKSVGGAVDVYGNITVYHRTDEKNVARIKGTGIMIAKEDGLFFSTKEIGQNEGYGESVVKLSIPVEKLVLDDVFSDEIHLRYPLENTRRLNVSDYLVTDNSIREVTHGEKVETMLNKEEKEALVQGVENGLDNGLYVSDEDLKQYKHIITERSESGMFRDITTYKTDIKNYARLITLDNEVSNNVSLNDLMDYLDDNTDLWSYSVGDLEEAVNNNTPVILVSDGNEERYFEIPEEAVTVVRNLIEKESEANKVTFFVAESMEFHNLGAVYENIPTIEEAIKIYKELPDSVRNMGNGIGAVVNDWEYSLYENEIVDTLEYYDENIRQNENIKNAVKSLNGYVADKKIQLYEDKGFVFINKNEYSDSYKYHLAKNLQVYSDLHYTDEATVYLAQAKSKFIDVDNAGINPTMSMEEITNAINKKAGIIDFKSLYNMDYLVIDSETTGFGKDDEIIELGITDKQGNVIYEGMFKPNKEISKEASLVNGITMSDLENKPTFDEEIDKITRLIGVRPIVMYNKDFDSRMILQSIEAHKDDMKTMRGNFSHYKDTIYHLEQIFDIKTFCAMQSYTAYKDFYKSTKLVEALKEQGIDKTQSHRAVDDCIDTANLIRIVAEKEATNEFNLEDVDILDKLDNMNGSEISENVYHFIMDNNYNDSISSRVLELLKEDEFKDIVTDVDLYNNDLIYMTAIKDVLNNGNQVVTDTQIGWGNIKLLSEVQNVKNANLVADIKGIEFYNRVDNPNLLITYNENYKIDTDENIKNACNRIFNNYYSDDLEEHLFKQSNEWSKNNISPHREDNSITLHIKYQEPIQFNGFTVESDTITFDNQEELDKFVKGEVAYDTLDNAVRKKDNEILLYADNKKGEVIWKAETQQSNKDIKPSNGKEVERMEETTKAVETENEELSPKDLLMKQLADGIKNTLDSEHFADWCKKQGRLYYNNYSLRNAMLTYLQKPEASYVCGYEKWKDFGRQVKQGAKGIKVLAPTFVKEYGAKGSLLASIKKACNEQLKKDPSLEFATYRLGQSKLSFNMYKNGLFDVKVGDDVLMPHITSDDMRKFLDKSVIGKIPAYYNAITVFDVQDTTNEVEHLWVKDNYKKEELVLDDNGNPIKNKKGQYKILNNEERKARFTADIDMTINEADTDKMEILYDTLKTISNNKGIPLTEAEPSSDKTLNDGALGYFRHPTEEHTMGNIVISSDLAITDKVAVTFHEMAHSDLHADIDWLKDEMDLDAGEKVTRQMKETQAEAVAYMTASNFGIETEHKSFEYIANWSNGRDLKELEKSLDVIYKESRQLMKDIEAELDTRGFDMSLEIKDKSPLSDELKKPIITSYKEFIVNTMRDNESVQKTAFEDFKSISDDVVKGIVKEQIALSHKIDEHVSKLNEHVDKFEVSTDRQEQTSLQYQMKADMTKISSMQTQLSNLSEERVTAVLVNADEKKSDMKALYASNPLKAMEQLKKDNGIMKDLTDNDLKYLANSKFISREYSKYLGSDNDKFINLATKQLDNIKSAMSKNNTVVEIAFCEQWSDKPIFKAGTVSHPKVANKIIAQAEKQTEEFKKKAEKEDDYYPYSKCDVTVYSITDKNKLTVLNTRIDIGDGQQKDLTDHLNQVCSKGKEKQAVLENFTKSTRERGDTLLLTPQHLDKDINDTMREEEHYADKSLSMSEWKSELNIKSDKESIDKGREENVKNNSEKERA